MYKPSKRKVHNTSLFDEGQVTTSTPIKTKNKFAKLEDNVLSTEDHIKESVGDILKEMEKKMEVGENLSSGVIPNTKNSVNNHCNSDSRLNSDTSGSNSTSGASMGSSSVNQGGANKTGNVSFETRSTDHLTINSNNNLSLMVKNIFREMWDSVLPVLTTTITTIVQSVLQSEMMKVRDRFNADLNILNYRIDELEQYTRRDSLRIGGLKEEEGEDLVPKICSILSEVGCPISPDDISTCHRVGRRGRAPGPKPRQVICKLVRRSKKIEILRNKRNLRSSDRGKDVFIYEDLTQTRMKMLKKLKESGRFKSVYSRDGKIHCKNDQRTVTINSPDDLFSLGFDENLFKELGFRVE